MVLPLIFTLVKMVPSALLTAGLAVLTLVNVLFATRTFLMWLAERTSSWMAAGAPLRFFAYNALTGPLLEGYDAVQCSLFLHHLDEPDALALLQRMAAMANRLVLVNDLERGWLGLLAAHVVTRLLTTSYVVHVDGPRSVEGAFTVAEARKLAQRAGLENAQVARRWPIRWLLTWNTL